MTPQRSGNRVATIGPMPFRTTRQERRLLAVLALLLLLSLLGTLLL